MFGHDVDWEKVNDRLAKHSLYLPNGMPLEEALLKIADKLDEYKASLEKKDGDE